MKKYFYILTFAFGIFSAQLPNISFNGTNAWTKNPTNANITFDTANNQATIVNSNSSQNVRTTLDKNITAPATFYFYADVWIEGVQDFNEGLIKNPTMLVRNAANNVIFRYNMKYAPQNTWFKVGFQIDNYTGSTIQFEFGMNQIAGTMKVKNPVLATSAPAFTYEFPWAVPSDITTTLNVNTAQKHTFENDILSANTHFVFAKVPWSSTTIQTPINTYFPMSNLRFPGGTIGNFYNYNTDNFYNDPLTPNNLITYNNNGNTLDYNGYKNFNISSGATATYMLNVMLGTEQTAINEYQNRYNSGLPLKWVELGNEMYLTENQNATNVTDVTTYKNHVKQISTGIKGINSNAKVAVCLNKDDFSSGSWNQTLSLDQTYYDAATIHNYIPIDHYFYSKYSSYGMLKSYKTSLNRFTDFKAMFPTKPLLLTEWGITGNVTEPYFLNTLGVAEIFLAIEKANELNIVKQAGIHMLYKNDSDEYATLMYYDTNNKLRLTTIGKLYSKLFEVFKNSEVYNAETTSAELETGLKAVNAKMVKKGTTYKIFVVNKLPVASPFSLVVDGVPYSGSYTLENYSGNMNSTISGVLATTNVWTTTNNSSGSISLPPSSISIITLPSSFLQTSQNNFSKEISVYPNPVVDKLFINNSEKNVNLVVEIYDATGRKVVEEHLSSSHFINVERLTKGSYIVKLLSEKEIVGIKKIIKK